MAVADRPQDTGFNTTAVLLCGVAVLVFLFVMALFIQGGFLAAQGNEIEAKVYHSPGSEEKRAALAEQQALLDEKVRWRDEEIGTVIMPIEDAMERLVTELGDSE
jgi:hypothetical protein